jgi:3-deoxy-D-manno-octulosonic-acid transferase
MFLLYNFLLTLFAPFWAPWMVWRAWRRKEKPNWKERQGDYRESIPKKGDRPRLWVHTVSVGEFVAAKPLLKALRAEFSEHEIVVSVTTSSGHQTAREAEEGLYDYLVYLPIDVARFTMAAMQRVRPDALIVLETELWMNLFWAADIFGVRTYVVNARISDRSYPRSQKLTFFYRALFGFVAKVLAQTETDAERFRSLGAENVQAVGNIKFDQALETAHDPARWRTELGSREGRLTILVGSLRAEEFTAFAPEVAKLVDRADFVIAPRHLERGAEFESALRSIAPGIDIRHRSKSEKLPRGGVLMLDTYGELAEAYAAADIAIVGGGFANLGGQNIIQPLSQGVPTLHGSHMKNFRDVVALSEAAGASYRCSLSAHPETGARSLGPTLSALIDNPEERKRMGEAARALIAANRGAAVRMAQIIADDLTPAS